MRVAINVFTIVGMLIITMLSIFAIYEPNVALGLVLLLLGYGPRG